MCIRESQDSEDGSQKSENELMGVASFAGMAKRKMKLGLPDGSTKSGGAMRKRMMNMVAMLVVGSMMTSFAWAQGQSKNRAPQNTQRNSDRFKVAPLRLMRSPRRATLGEGEKD